MDNKLSKKPSTTCYSKERDSVVSGVPQGSILGLVLFLIYVNDIPDLAESTAKMFIDDTKLYRDISDTTDCEILQDDLNKLASWSQLWLFKIQCKQMCGLKNQTKYTLPMLS